MLVGLSCLNNVEDGKEEDGGGRGDGRRGKRGRREGRENVKN